MTKSGLLRKVVGISSAIVLTACGSKEKNSGGLGMLEIGSRVPNLEGVDQNGSTHKFQDEAGHPVIVYFYPKDSTPGCTKEACAFRDAWDKYAAANVKIFGVSSDSMESHSKFAEKHKIPFPLIVDKNKEWVKAFGVPTTLGIAKRVSFLINKEGVVSKIYSKVDPGVHADEVLKDVEKL